MPLLYHDALAQRTWQIDSAHTSHRDETLIKLGVAFGPRVWYYIDKEWEGQRRPGKSGQDSFPQWQIYPATAFDLLPRVD